MGQRAHIAKPRSCTLCAAQTGSRELVALRATALTSLTAARRLAAGLEHAELALIEAARDGGATWSQIAAALGASNRQTAQKRHADLSRRWPRPPSVDASAATEAPAAAPPAGGVHKAGGTSTPRETGHDGHAASTHDPGAGNSAPAETGSRGEAGRLRRARSPATCEDAGPLPRAAPAAGGGRRADPKITGAIIAEGRYEIVRAPDHAETRAWHVLVGGRRAGLVRPTWRGERSRPGWEAIDDAGTALPATGIGRVAGAGNARTRDAAAVSLLRALQRQQEQERKKAVR